MQLTSTTDRYLAHHASSINSLCGQEKDRGKRRTTTRVVERYILFALLRLTNEI